MAKTTLHYRNHEIEVEESIEGYPEKKIVFRYKILRQYLGSGNYNYDNYKIFNTLYAAQIDAYQIIDSAYEKVEKRAKVQRELTKNDFDGFVQLLEENSKIPSDQILKIAIEMLQAHYQRININDNSDVADAINELAKSIESSFYDSDAGYSVGSVLSKIRYFLEENYKT